MNVAINFPIILAVGIDKKWQSDITEAHDMILIRATQVVDY